jgi:hypothetical protein
LGKLLPGGKEPVIPNPLTWQLLSQSIAYETCDLLAEHQEVGGLRNISNHHKSARHFMIRRMYEKPTSDFSTTDCE